MIFRNPALRMLWKLCFQPVGAFPLGEGGCTNPELTPAQRVHRENIKSAQLKRKAKNTASNANLVPTKAPVPPPLPLQSTIPPSSSLCTANYSLSSPNNDNDSSSSSDESDSRRNFGNYDEESDDGSISAMADTRATQCHRVSSDASSTSSDEHLLEQEKDNSSSFETDHSFHRHAPEYDQSASNYSFEERLMHFLYPHFIDSTTQAAVEIALLIEAGSEVSESTTTSTEDRGHLMETTYRDLVNSISGINFRPEAMKTKMLTKLYQAKKDIDGHQLYSAFKKKRSAVRNDFRSPDVPSGHQLRDVVNTWRANTYAEDHPMKCEGLAKEEILELIPADWEFKHPKAKGLLAKQVHRNNKEICTKPSEQPAGKTRKEQRKAAATNVVEERANASMLRDVVNEESQERRRLHVTVAQLAMVKMQTDAISMQIKLYHDNREFFVRKYGKDAWIDKINSLLSKLPDPGAGEERETFDNTTNTSAQVGSTSMNAAV